MLVSIELLRCLDGDILIPLMELGGLISCLILRRESRFTVRVLVNGAEREAHLGNTGRLQNYLVKGRKGYCIPAETGRLGLRLIGVEEGLYAALIDTRLQEKGFELLLERGLIPWLSGCRLVKRNIRLGDSVIDYLIECLGVKTLVELKSAVMDLGGRIAGYPDAPTSRGARQLLALAHAASSGVKAAVVFIAGIPLATGFRFYCGVDKNICKAVAEAYESDVVFKAVNIFLEPAWRNVVAGSLELPVDLSCCFEESF
jgi:sugar fermentation stimulation protein A